MAGGRPKVFKSVEDIEDKVKEYKIYLKENSKPPTMAGLAYYLGVDRKTLYNYSKDDQFFPTIKKYRDWIVMTLEESGIEKGNGGTVFLMKNYGYTDKQEIEAVVADVSGSMSQEELQARIDELMNK